MSDNLKKKKLDGKRISRQPWEQRYQKQKAAAKKKRRKSKSVAKRQNVGTKRHYGYIVAVNVLYRIPASRSGGLKKIPLL